MGTYKVEHFSNDSTPVPTDISTFVHSVDYVNLFSDGRINTAALTLQAQAGQFMTNSSSGTTPILSNFDRIRITGTDPDGNSYSHIFEIINDLAQLSQSAEYLLPLTLEGRERALAVIPFSGYFDPLDHRAMVAKILNTYFTTFNPLLQPLIRAVDDFGFNSNNLPEYSPNIWDFQYIDNCLDAIQAVVRLANQSVAAGGGGDRFSIIFKDDDTFPLSRVNIGINSQGFTNAGNTFPIIRSNELTNPIKIIAKTKQPLTGTVVIARGRPGSGGVPVSGDIYRSRLEFYQRIQARQIWSATINYDADALTSFDNQVYEAILDNFNSRPDLNPSDWKILSAGEFIGTTLQYSPFTIDKAALYRNECTNPNTAFASESENSPKMLDCNIVIEDVETKRDWVYIRQITDNIASWSTDEKQYLFKNTSVYNGFRILVDTTIGTPSGSFNALDDNFGTGAGNDPNGKPYADNQVVFVDGNWFVIKEHVDFDQTLVRFEGLFEWNVAFVAKSKFPASDNTNPFSRRRQAGGGGTFAWRVLGEQFLSNDCLHSPSSIVNSEGLIRPVSMDISSDEPKGTVVLTGDAVTSITVTDGGANQTAGVASVSIFSPNGVGSGATGTPVVSGGVVTSVTINTGGTGYTTDDPPIVVFNSYTHDSAVKIIYEYGSTVDFPEWRKTLDQLFGIAASALGFVGNFAAGASVALYNLFLTPVYRNMGWWITLSAPFPVAALTSGPFSISEQVGELYGAGTGFLVSKLNDHSTFDAFNQTSTFTGDNSWNASDSNGMMEITGVTFLFRLDIRSQSGTIPFTGDIPCSYWVIDDNGTIWKAKAVYRHLNDVQRMTFDFGDFSPVYRARSPFGIENIVTNILTPELEIRERLFPNRIRLQGFMLEGSYDEKGRYMPNLWETIIKPTIANIFDNTVITNLQFIGEIDYFQWVKTPIAISIKSPTSRHIFPEFKDYPNISNVEQLQNAATADLDVEKFQYEQYIITRNNKADIALQDTVYLFEEFMISEAEAPIPTGVSAYNAATTYGVDELVDSVSVIYISLQPANLNNTPASNPLFWSVVTDPVANTRELTVGEIQFSVTNGKDIEFQHTLIRRIPKVI